MINAVIRQFSRQKRNSDESYESDSPKENAADESMELNSIKKRVRKSTNVPNRSRNNNNQKSKPTIKKFLDLMKGSRPYLYTAHNDNLNMSNFIQKSSSEVLLAYQKFSQGLKTSQR